VLDRVEAAAPPPLVGAAASEDDIDSSHALRIWTVRMEVKDMPVLGGGERGGDWRRGRWIWTTISGRAAVTAMDSCKAAMGSAISGGAVVDKRRSSYSCGTGGRRRRPRTRKVEQRRASWSCAGIRTTG
jgi:hypothetical protein